MSGKAPSSSVAGAIVVPRNHLPNLGTAAIPQSKQASISVLLQTTIRTILARLTPSPSTSLLPFIPKPLKIFLLLLVILNSPSFPFQWHLRVWGHALKAYYLVYRKGRGKYLRDWEAQNMAVGQIRTLRTRIKRLAWLDDCDYNIHLSNSCYSKNSDSARMDYCIQSMSPIFTPGVNIALAGTHYNFIKEIPMGSSYVMETRTAGWGEKWIYLVTEFIIYPKSKTTSKATSIKAEIDTQISKASTSTSGPIIPSISAPSTKESTPQGTRTGSPMPNIEEAKKAAARTRPPRSDGGVVACIAVFEYCFKIGRVTIPPRIALYFSFQSPVVEERAHAHRLISSKDLGKAWLRGGWRNEPNADEIGRNIGVVESGDDEAWYDKTKKHMEGVEAGLSAL